MDDATSLISKVPNLIGPVPSPNLDSNLTLFSEPSGCPLTRNRYVPIPDVVVPNPTTVERTSYTSVLSNSLLVAVKETIPEFESYTASRMPV